MGRFAPMQDGALRADAGCKMQDGALRADAGWGASRRCKMQDAGCKMQDAR